MKVEVTVTLKEGVLDPQGKAIHHALNALKFDGVSDVKVGKLITLELDSDDASCAHVRVREMCESLLANTVIENYHIKMP